MWLVLAFLSAALLGFSDAFQKKALSGNAVIPVLFLNTLFSSLIFLPFSVMSYTGNSLDGTIDVYKRQGKYYARPVVTETIGIDKLAEHMASHNTPFSKGAIKGLLTDMVSCVKAVSYTHLFPASCVFPHMHSLPCRYSL